MVDVCEGVVLCGEVGWKRGRGERAGRDGTGDAGYCGG